MSRKVIRYLVIPIVQKLFPNIVIDEQLMDYLDRELTFNLGVTGRADHCENLEEHILEILQRNPEAFRKFVKRLVEKYVEKREPKTEKEAMLYRERENDVPDRLQEARKEAKEIWLKG